MKKIGLEMTRRQVLKTGMIGGAGLLIPWRFLTPAQAQSLLPGVLSDPAAQPKFKYSVPDALSPGFIYKPDKKGIYKIITGTAVQQTGLEDSSGNPLNTTIWGYGDQKDKFISWPGRTFQIKSGDTETQVIWSNEMDAVKQHLLPVDTSLHWCYSLHGYKKYTIKKNGIPIITHLHGGHTDWEFDGNPEFFYSPAGKKQVIGPQWDNVPEGFTTKFRYDNNVPAGNLWYHDHALGITRLNVYAGMAGFYFMRDNFDTGLEDNPLNLPAWPYEKAYAIQDRMFRNTGELFYPAFPGEPFWDDFITDEDVAVCPEFPTPPATKCVTAPSALAEFFGDHMVVNGVIWPKEDVKPRNYRLHLLNGTDSRFMVFQFVSVNAGVTDPNDSSASAPLPFNVIGSDQGLASSATQTDTLVSEPGSRYDIVFDFKGLQGKRIILKNEGWDAPFGSDFGRNNPEAELFTDSQTDRIMAFDVEETDNIGDSFNTNVITAYDGNTNTVDRVRKVALFEGKDEYGRLQPLLGTAEEATDYLGNPIPWPEDSPNYDGLNPNAGMEGSLAWHSPTTENPALNSTEIWEIYNATGDAHPVHLHLVNFQVGLSAADEHTYGPTRQEIVWDNNTTEDERFIPNEDYNVPAGNGTYLVKQPVSQHDGTQGVGFRLMNITLGDPVDIGPSDGYVENAPKDMVTALPGQVTRIKATFDKSGRYVWHCHILSHEDHEMMRVLHVGPGA